MTRAAIYSKDKKKWRKNDHQN